TVTETNYPNYTKPMDPASTTKSIIINNVHDTHQYPTNSPYNYIITSPHTTTPKTHTNTNTPYGNTTNIKYSNTQTHDTSTRTNRNMLWRRQDNPFCGLMLSKIECHTCNYKV